MIDQKENSLPENNSATPVGNRRLGSSWIPLAFPGLTVVDLQDEEAGSGISRIQKVGVIKIHSLLQGRLSVCNNPDLLPAEKFTAGLFYQKSGKTEVTYAGQTFHIDPGSIFAADGGHPFELESLGMVQTYVIILPRNYALEQLPNIFGENARIIPPSDPLVALIVGLIEDTLQIPSELTTTQENGIAEAFMALFRALPALELTQEKKVHWRIIKAIEQIEASLSDRELSPDFVAAAQGISRRRLDQLFVDELGTTISFQISEHRLTVAAATLCNPEKKHEQITSVAFACGYRDLPHFSRSFKNRFGLTPKQWRRNTLNE